MRAQIASQMQKEIEYLPESSDQIIRERVFEVINGMANIINSGY